MRRSFRPVGDLASGLSRSGPAPSARRSWHRRGISGGLSLRTGVDERDLPLAPDQTPLPRDTSTLPDDPRARRAARAGSGARVARAPAALAAGRAGGRLLALSNRSRARPRGQRVVFATRPTRSRGSVLDWVGDLADSSVRHSASTSSSRHESGGPSCGSSDALALDRDTARPLRRVSPTRSRRAPRHPCCSPPPAPVHASSLPPRRPHRAARPAARRRFGNAGSQPIGRRQLCIICIREIRFVHWNSRHNIRTRCVTSGLISKFGVVGPT